MRAPTTTVEIDTGLLERLRDRFSGRSDRELLESAARIRLGRETIRAAQDLIALGDEQAIELGVRAVHESRRCRRLIVDARGDMSSAAQSVRGSAP